MEMGSVIAFAQDAPIVNKTIYSSLVLLILVIAYFISSKMPLVTA